MAKHRVFVSRRVPEPVHAALAGSFELDYHDSQQPLSRNGLVPRVAGANGLVTTLADKVDAELLDAAGPQLQVVANCAVGFDNVDVDAAVARDVVVTNTPDVLTEATAEFAVTLMLSLLRRVTEGDRFLHRRESWVWAPTMMLGTSPRGRVLGVVGFGRIGREVAALARALGMRVIYSDLATIPSDEYEQVPLTELLERADVVSLHCPLVPETHHLIGERELGTMRRDAFLINTARGPVVDEKALVAALRDGEIAGAGIDVFEQEPSVPDALLEFDNVVVTPHLASATHHTREAMGMLCHEALEAVLLEGRAPAHALNPDQVGSRR